VQAVTRGEKVAREWHGTYERLAAEYNCALPGLGVAWDDLTDAQRELLVAVANDLRSRAVFG
jgi:hypothetical protein